MVTQNKQAILYSFRRCPYAIRARLALFYAGVDCELREIVLKTKPQQMLDVSTKGTVPVLVLDDQVIDESIDIMQWALEQSDPNNWGAENLQHSLVKRNDKDFKYYLDRYKYYDRYPEHSQSDYLEKACEFIQELESVLCQKSNQANFLNGRYLSALDIALYPFIRQFAFVDKTRFDQLPFPKAQKWLAHFLHSDLFANVMLKYKQWQPNQPVVNFSSNEIPE